MSTLADIRKAAESNTATYIDNATPDGCFGATARILGVVTSYVLHGELNDADAEIVERTEIHNLRQYRYVGNGLKGGSFAR